MKVLIFSLISLLYVVGSSQPLLAAGNGACSWHGGVDCSAGSDYDDSAICNDGWKDSTVAFRDVCESNNDYIYIYDCDEYYGIMNDYAELKISPYSSKPYYLLVANTCQITYKGFLPQGKLRYKTCPISSHRDESNNKCKCDENFFSNQGKCTPGWELCSKQFGPSATWDFSLKKCGCKNPDEIIDPQTSRCGPITLAAYVSSGKNTDDARDRKSVV